MHAYDLSPLFRSTIGFDRINQLIDSAFKMDERALAYPPYNIVKTGEDTYEIVMAVAGFKQEDLNIVVQENTLIVSGANGEKEEEQGAAYLHKGIATRNFERKFQLADHVKVADASLDNGLLTLHLRREVPEASRPRTVAINNTTGKTVEASSKKKIANG